MKSLGKSGKEICLEIYRHSVLYVKDVCTLRSPLILCKENDCARPSRGECQGSFGQCTFQHWDSAMH